MVLPSFAATDSLGEGTLVSLATVKQSELSAETLQEEVTKAQEEATEAAQSSIDPEAIAAVEETKKAIVAIDKGKFQDAIQALELATGKLDILLARNPKLAFIPLSSMVEVIDVAPQDKQSLKIFLDRLQSAINIEDYPAAREILDNLISEVRTKTVNVPLASYTEAMKDAARLLDNKQPEVAKALLQTALSTLVITETNRPIPIINAQTELIGAIALAQTDKENAIKLMENARQDLQLAKDLGYAKGDLKYVELDKIIASIEKKIRINADVASAFGELQDELTNFLGRVSA
ncbi:YfdX family protein [Pleurocapsales cyanobacterium LEGE 10410]|nr:YfdX family protein [Pleurocapsales cyanobacterium LEGE 10410]